MPGKTPASMALGTKGYQNKNAICMNYPPNKFIGYINGGGEIGA